MSKRSQELDDSMSLQQFYHNASGEHTLIHEKELLASSTDRGVLVIWNCHISLSAVIVVLDVKWYLKSHSIGGEMAEILLPVTFRHWLYWLGTCITVLNPSISFKAQALDCLFRKCFPSLRETIPWLGWSSSCCFPCFSFAGKDLTSVQNLLKKHQALQVSEKRRKKPATLISLRPAETYLNMNCPRWTFRLRQGISHEQLTVQSARYCSKLGLCERLILVLCNAEVMQRGC